MQELEKILEEIVEEQRSYEADHAWNYARGLEYAADIIRKHMKNEEDILKFYYCESEDDYYIGKEMPESNFYYAKYEKTGFVWFMSRYLPWGEHVVNSETAWKEYTYPTEPIEIPFMEWIEGFIRKHLSRENGSEITRSSRDTEDGWIPVDERLPAEGEEVLITTDVGLIATGYIHCCEWITGVEPDYPIAWRPLPEPYRPDQERSVE